MTCLVAASDLDDGTDVGNSDRPCGSGQGVDEVSLHAVSKSPVARYGHSEVGGADESIGHANALPHVGDRWLLDSCLQHSESLRHDAFKHCREL